MSQDPDNEGAAGEEGERAPTGDGTKRSAGHLPPPAFPPSARRRQADAQEHRAERADAPTFPVAPPADGSGVPDEAFIPPDEEIPPRFRVPEEAFISPDEPIVRQHPVRLHEVDPNDVVVTGMGNDAHLSPEELAAGGDPHVIALVETVGKLAEALRRKGEAGLRTEPDMSRFEATLRAYCVGYLAGRRAEDEES